MLEVVESEYGYRDCVCAQNLETIVPVVAIPGTRCPPRAPGLVLVATPGTRSLPGGALSTPGTRSFDSGYLGSPGSAISSQVILSLFFSFIAWTLALILVSI